jgi:hypothetical protein
LAYGFLLPALFLCTWMDRSLLRCFQVNGFQFAHCSFGWRQIMHPLFRQTQLSAHSGILSECPIWPRCMRLYRDHRVMASIVLPGVSHVGLLCASFWHTHGDATAVSLKSFFFQRPFFVKDMEAGRPHTKKHPITRKAHRHQAPSTSTSELVYASADRTEAQPTERATRCDITSVDIRSNLVVSPTQTLYLAYSSSGLQYGPRFRTCTDSAAAPPVATAVVKYTTASESWERHSYVHPGIQDGSLHSMMKLQQTPHDHDRARAPCLPFMITRLYLAALRVQNVFV